MICSYLALSQMGNVPRWNKNAQPNNSCKKGWRINLTGRLASVRSAAFTVNLPLWVYFNPSFNHANADGSVDTAADCARSQEECIWNKSRGWKLHSPAVHPFPAEPLLTLLKYVIRWLYLMRSKVSEASTHLSSFLLSYTLTNSVARPRQKRARAHTYTNTHTRTQTYEWMHTNSHLQTHTICHWREMKAAVVFWFHLLPYIYPNLCVCVCVIAAPPPRQHWLLHHRRRC